MDFKRIKLVYAIRGDRGVTVNRENAETIAKWAPKLGIHEVIATLSRSHVTQKDVVSESELAVFLEVMEEAGIKVQLYEELPEAIKHSLRRCCRWGFTITSWLPRNGLWCKNCTRTT